MSSLTLKDNTILEFSSTKVMGILNATPDSFFEESRNSSLETAIRRAREMIEWGAEIIDIGGESTRPGSDPVTEEEEIKRVLPLVEAIRTFDKNILISIDTYRAETAKQSILAGADIINDISAMTFDTNMPRVVKEYNVPIILMHIKGTPKNMQKNPVYSNVIGEVGEFFKERINYAAQWGIDRNKIILDPGIGFGKLYEHNIELIKRIDEFKSFGCPILLAASRKSTIGIAIGDLPPEERLEGTIAVSCYASLKNVEMIRVHDVKENIRAIRMIEALK